MRDFSLREHEELLKALHAAVVVGNIKGARKKADEAISRGISANLVLERLMDAMRVVDEKYERHEYFVVDVAAAASAMREAFRIVEPHLQVETADVVGKIVIGSLKGNTQSLGKDVVAAVLRAAGFHVVDLGVDVQPSTFVDVAVREEAQIIAISVLMRETVLFLREVVDHLQQRGLKGKVKVIIGGQAVSEQTCRKYGIEAYARDAWEGVKKVKDLLRTEQT
ncbi:MAG: cobalamin B12-binding domain-containing protein [Candidatus Freyarchaeota archaeon]